MASLDAQATYELVAALFQLLLAPLIALTRARPAIRLALPTILVLNAAESLRSPLMSLGLIEEGAADIAGLADPLIVMSLAFLLSQLPVPLGGERGARLAFRLWLGAGLAWALAWIVLEDAARWTVFSQIGPFLAAAMLLAAHVIPRWRELPSGPLRGQTLLLASGVGIGLTVIALRNLSELSRPPFSAREVVLALMAPAILAALLPLAADALGRRRDALVFLAVLGLGVPFAVAEWIAPVNLQEFASQTVRPFLFAAAILRYDLVEVPRRALRILFPATLAALTITGFFGLHAILTLQNVALVPAAAAVSLGGLVLTAVLLRRPLGQVLRASGGEIGSAERIERYRLALEAAGDPFASPDLARLRGRLRITDEEHDTLVTILRSHVVVPTRAVRGLQAGDRVAGGHEILRELGRGGQGRALLARRDMDGALLVLKEVARPWEAGAQERAAALAREAEVGASIRSPRVARVFGVVEDGGLRYLAREFVPGRTLAEVVAEEGPLPADRARRVLHDVLEGLAAVHEAGLLHLDLKPANVVLAEDGRAVIIDLGTARAPSAATLTQGAAPGGSFGWMAPEQLSGGRVGPPSDVYAAGALLAFLLTGRPPSPAGVVAPSGMLGEIVRRACAGEPGARYRGAREMTEQLA